MNLYVLLPINVHLQLSKTSKLFCHAIVKKVYLIISRILHILSFDIIYSNAYKTHGNVSSCVL